MNIEFTMDSKEFLNKLASAVGSEWCTKNGNVLINDMYLLARGAAPVDTGNLENSICQEHKVIPGQGWYEGNIDVSAYAPHNGFNYGALRHDYPFNLGPKSQEKSPATSALGGVTLNVGYGFAARTEEAAEGYFKMLENSLRLIISRYCI